MFRENIATVASEENIDKSLLSKVSFAFIEHAVLHTWISEFDSLVIDVSDEIVELLVDDISPYLYMNLGVVHLVAETLRSMDPSELDIESDVDFAEYVVPAVEVAGWEYSAELDPNVGVRVFASTNSG